MGFYRILVHSPTISLAGSVEGIKIQQTSEHELIQSHEIIHLIIFFANYFISSPVSIEVTGEHCIIAVK